MKFPDRETVECVKKAYPVGSIVVLDSMDDVQAPRPGTLGIVQFVDDTGSIGVSWQGGGSLNVVYGVDRCHLANKEEQIKYGLQKLAAHQKDGDRCPRCGTPMPGKLTTHALSRRADIMICDGCGTVEALEDAGLSGKMPISDWVAVKDEWISK